MAKRKFLLASCLLLIGAIACQFTSLSCGKTAMLLVAKMDQAANQLAPPEQPVGPAGEVDRVLHLIPYFAAAGLVLAFAGLWLGIVAHRRREPGWRSAPFALAVLYLFTLFLLV